MANNAKCPAGHWAGCDGRGPNCRPAGAAAVAGAAVPDSFESTLAQPSAARGAAVTDMYQAYSEQQPPGPGSDRGWTSTRVGMAMPGTRYEGVVVYYRNPQTGDVRVEWSGEAHGSWQAPYGQPDPASEIIAGMHGSTDGYLPHRAVLSAPHRSLPRTHAEYDVILDGATLRETWERVYLSRKLDELKAQDTTSPR